MSDVQELVAKKITSIKRNLSKEDLLPHFTPFLAVQLQCRLVRRICEDSQTFQDFSSCNHLGFTPRELAGQLVDRIYRTQLKEAKATLSFADAMIAYAEQQNTGEVAGDTAAPELTEGLVMPFRGGAYAGSA